VGDPIAPNAPRSAPHLGGGGGVRRGFELGEKRIERGVRMAWHARRPLQAARAKSEREGGE